MAKIGPREEQLRAMRERNFERAAATPKRVVADLREKVASIPTRKPPSERKKKR